MNFTGLVSKVLQMLTQFYDDAQVSLLFQNSPPLYIEIRGRSQTSLTTIQQWHLARRQNSAHGGIEENLITTQKQLEDAIKQSRAFLHLPKKYKGYIAQCIMEESKLHPFDSGHSIQMQLCTIKLKQYPISITLAYTYEPQEVGLSSDQSQQFELLIDQSYENKKHKNGGHLGIIDIPRDTRKLSQGSITSRRKVRPESNIISEVDLPIAVQSEAGSTESQIIEPSIFNKGSDLQAKLQKAEKLIDEINEKGIGSTLGQFIQDIQ